jgi:alpha-galactosidase
MISRTVHVKFIFLLLTIVPVTSGQAQEAFRFTGSGIVIDFDFFRDHLRQRWMLPAHIPPDSGLVPMRSASEVETALHITGRALENRKRIGGSPGTTLRFLGTREDRTPGGTIRVIKQEDTRSGLIVESVYEFYDDIPVIRRHTRLTNRGSDTLGVEYVSSAMLHNFGDFGAGGYDDKLKVHWAHNTWFAEGQWHSSRPSELGMVENKWQLLSGIFMQNLGSWSSVRYLPMAMVENEAIGVTWFWQIEHNGSWHWEISDAKSSYDFQSNTVTLANKGTYLYIGGPDEEYGHAWKALEPGERYETVPVALGCIKGGFQEAVRALTSYRRRVCLRVHPDNRECPVVFNDYMNCLMADPTTEKELPLIDAASRAGCDYYVIDAGWFGAKGESWGTTKGDYLPSRDRFDGGIRGILNEIRKKNMVPGLWLELEVAAAGASVAGKPDDWFFMRHGQRVNSGGIYLLDYRNPGVIGHADEVVDRLAGDYQVGYIKMDYNVDAKMGTDRHAESPGQGLLGHNRAYLAWLDGVYERHPGLTIENCASGGCRMDYALLSRHQLQSSSDQMDYRKYPALIPGTMAAVLPEQLAAWSYPLAGADPDEASFNMVTAMLCRIHMSGRIDRLSPESFEQVRQGIAVYKEQIQPILHRSFPFFPLGMPSVTDDVSPIAVGLETGEARFVAVWRLQGGDEVILPEIAGEGATLLYPSGLGIGLQQHGRDLVIDFPRTYMAAVIKLY